MNKKTVFIIAIVLSTVLFASTLTGCADMGDFSSVTVIDGQSVECYDEYYQLFTGQSAELISQDKSSESYGIEDSLFNASIVNTLKPENPDDAIPQEEYLYFSVGFDKDMTIDEFALYFLTDSNLSLDVLAYVVSQNDYDLMTDKIRAYDDALYEQKKDNDGNLLFEDEGKTIPLPDTDKKIEYSDPKKEDAVYHSSISLGTMEDCVYIRTFLVDDKTVDTIRVAKGDRFVLYFRSNSGYGKDESYPLIKFGVSNMLFCVRDIGE